MVMKFLVIEIPILIISAKERDIVSCFYDFRSSSDSPASLFETYVVDVMGANKNIRLN